MSVTVAVAVVGRMEVVVLGVAMEVSESADVEVDEDEGEWIANEAVLGIMIPGEMEPSGVWSVVGRGWSFVVVVMLSSTSDFTVVGVSVFPDCAETDLTKPTISSEIQCHAEIVFR